MRVRVQSKTRKLVRESRRAARIQELQEKEKDEERRKSVIETTQWRTLWNLYKKALESEDSYTILQPSHAYSVKELIKLAKKEKKISYPMFRKMGFSMPKKG